MSSPFVLTAIIADVERAARCDLAGVDRIGVDIERIGKHARQGSVPNARISDHELEQLEALRPVVQRAQLFARLNPLHDGTGAEVDRAVACGAQVLMLPYFTSAHEVETFVRLVDGRAAATLLLETAAAVVRLPDILAVDGVAEITVGLNDLSLSCGLANAFEVLASDMMDHISAGVRKRGVPFGFGGVARAHDEALSMPSDLVFAQHPRLGSNAAWLSRSFFGPNPDEIDIAAEVAALRTRLEFWRAQPADMLSQQRDEMRRRLAAGRAQQ
ncbi:MAG: aldolase [Hyphomonadaceae bacterium]|nr:MAG: HpcH/HpaI aldolase [Caulobacteraceae bacterium]MBT9445975.1 aldolase [Hyphomonadaceae bacterium]TPW04635.1 MAG: HpcH/HpaI aldolase [Alphaproteobacteria bacterium]